MIGSSESYFFHELIKDALVRLVSLFWLHERFLFITNYFLLKRLEEGDLIVDFFLSIDLFLIVNRKLSVGGDKLFENDDGKIIFVLLNQSSIITFLVTFLT